MGWSGVCSHFVSLCGPVASLRLFPVASVFCAFIVSPHSLTHSDSRSHTETFAANTH